MVQLRSRMVSYQGLREGEAGVVFNGCSFSYAGRVSSSELLYNTVPTVNTVWYTYTFAKKADFMLNALTLIKKKKWNRKHQESGSSDKKSTKRYSTLT